MYYYEYQNIVCKDRLGDGNGWHMFDSHNVFVMADRRLLVVSNDHKRYVREVTKVFRQKSYGYRNRYEHRAMDYIKITELDIEYAHR